MKNLQLIHDLCESRVFRTKQSIDKFSDRDKKELFYGILLSTIALAQDTHTNVWAEKYAAEAGAFGNFDYFRTSGSDLYVLTYILQNDLMLLSKSQAQVLIRLYRSISRGKFDQGFIEQTLLRMERMIGIGNSQLRNARRIIVNWSKSNSTERKQAVTRLHRFLRTKAKLAEVLPYLLVLTKGEKGHYGKMTPLKKAAAFGAAALAGFTIGYKMHNPNKRLSLRNSAEIDGNPLMEDRPTQLFNLVQNLRSHPDIEKVISVNYIADGISALVRDTEGNAYEFEIRPAPFAKGHDEKRGVTEDVVDLNAYRNRKIRIGDYVSFDDDFSGKGVGIVKNLEHDSTEEFCFNGETPEEYTTVSVEDHSKQEKDDGWDNSWELGMIEADEESFTKISQAEFNARKETNVTEDIFSDENPICEDCYDTGWSTEPSWEDTANVPCECKNALEFRNRFVQEDVWQWRCVDILNEDGISLLGKTP